MSRNRGINIFRRHSVSWRPGSPVTLRVGCEEPPPQRDTRGWLFVRGKVGLSRVQKHCSSVSREESLAEGSRQVAANDVRSSVRHGDQNVGAAHVQQCQAVKQTGVLGPTVDYYAAMKRSEAWSVPTPRMSLEHARFRKTIHTRCSDRQIPGAVKPSSASRGPRGLWGTLLCGYEVSFHGVDGLEAETGDDCTECACAEATGSCPLKRELGGT